jgi:hypothetical protein
LAISTASRRTSGVDFFDLVYPGFSQDVLLRIAFHTRGEHSNFLLLLFRLICELSWPGRYHLEGYPVYLLTHNEEAAIAEMVLARMTQAYAVNGGGFTNHAAGRNNPVSWDAGRSIRMRRHELRRSGQDFCLWDREFPPF